ncbi:hypothetical protein HPB50_016927 [Hyalomma asiaticum]|uniref:Uncharacterized protein n=1 Tax=Hyalomma asiaticum TaxID=266040 RepID=A0ACB7SWH9_HYAAI|nr:hypothetical protein HPB50_016927 [Hyalomma asiaticum]
MKSMVHGPFCARGQLRLIIRRTVFLDRVRGATPTNLHSVLEWCMAWQGLRLSVQASALHASAGQSPNFEVVASRRISLPIAVGGPLRIQCRALSWATRSALASHRRYSDHGRLPRWAQKLRVFKYIECPRQCSKCQRFGHVAGACRLPVRCPRCGGNHDRSFCATEQLQCPNCKKQHESTSSRCRVLRKEKEIHNYKMNHNVGYISAKAAIYEKRKAASRGSNDGTTVSCKDACKTAPENPPRIEDTEEFPSLPTRNLPLSPCVTAAKESTQCSGVRVQESTTAAGSSERRGPSVSWRGQRERSTRQDSSITYSLLSALVDAARSFLAPMSSPIAKVILTLLDFLSPVIERWR